MIGTAPRHHTLRRLIVSIGVCLGIAGQSAVLLASIADAWHGQDARSHVEQSGTSTHYAHSGACSLCQARSVQGLASGVRGPLLREVGITSGVLPINSVVVSDGCASASQPRAPPALS